MTIRVEALEEGPSAMLRKRDDDDRVIAATAAIAAIAATAATVAIGGRPRRPARRGARADEDARPKEDDSDDRSRRRCRARRPFFRRRKTCPFSGPNAPKIDYKDTRLLSRYISERGKIVPSRITAVSAKKQRELAKAIKRARFLGLLPYRDRVSAQSAAAATSARSRCNGPSGREPGSEPPLTAVAAGQRRMNDNHPPASWPDRAVGLGAGVAGALLFVVSTRGTSVAMALACFAPLPLMIGAAGFSLPGAMVGALIGAGVLLAAAHAPFALAFLLGFAVPSLALAAMVQSPLPSRVTRAPASRFAAPRAMLGTVFLLAILVTGAGVALSLTPHYHGFEPAMTAALQHSAPELDELVDEPAAASPAKSAPKA